MLILWLVLLCLLFCKKDCGKLKCSVNPVVFHFPADVTLCEEAFFRFAVPTKFTPNWLSILVDNLPGTKVNTESVERIKRRHSSQEQTFQLLKLWKHQNKDQDLVKKIIQGTGS